MVKRVLRSFLYLDENIVNDFLSQMEGGLLEGPYTTKDIKSGSKEGGIGGKILLDVNGKLGSSSSSETTQTIRETSGAKFARLYELLSEDETIQILNGFDLSVYETIEPGEIVEVRGRAELPRWEKISKALGDISGLADMLIALGMDPFDDPNSQIALQVMTSLNGNDSKKDTILTISPFGSPQFKFVAKLDGTRILRKKDDLEAEVTILGKVHKRLAKGEKIEVFSLISNLDQLANLNREQRRQTSRAKAGNKLTPSPIDEIIKYPAFQVIPIAVYQ